MRNSRGITIIGLAVMVVIIATLALVTLNMGVGENSIMSKAEKGVKDWDEKEIIDEVNVILADYAIDVALTDKDTINTYLTELVKENRIQDYKYIGYYLVKYKDLYCELEKDGYGYKVSKVREAGDDDGDDEYVIITSEVIADKTIDLEEEKKYILLDDTEAKDFNFDIPENQEITIILAENMTIDNKDVERSAINLNKNSKLNLYVYGKVTVNSGVAEMGDENDYKTSNKGGYAGIHVPEDATLNLYGEGTLTAIGGDAGDGNSYTTNLSAGIGGTGGGGAGAGIGGNGGDGTGYAVGKGSNGGSGGNCGKVNIYGNLTVYAYGGAGGSGGAGTKENGGGGGGYPAAGIGGGGAGGAGGTCCAGGGGYSGGGGDGYTGQENQSTNGNTGSGVEGGTNGGPSIRVKNNFLMLLGGSGYNQEKVSEFSAKLAEKIDYLYGGMGGVHSSDGGHIAGNGGIAGKGGIVKVSENAKVYAYNGNKYTDGTPYNNGINQTIIYGQNGIVHEKYVFGVARKDGVLWKSKIPAGSIGVLNYKNPTNGLTQGIGTGAGYTEENNGQYIIDSTLNNIPAI